GSTSASRRTSSRSTGTATRPSSATASRTGAAPSSSSRLCPLGTSSSSGARSEEHAGSRSSTRAPAVGSSLEERVLDRDAADVGPSQLRHDSASRCALDEAELEQVRLVDVLDRVRLL